MLRKWMLGAAAVAAIGFGAGAANAAPPVVVHPGTGGYATPAYYPPTYTPAYPQPLPRCEDFVVFVKRGFHWQRYDRFDTLRQAERAVRHLEREGRVARIEAVPERR
jgi:hypothetical protein